MKEDLTANLESKTEFLFEDFIAKLDSDPAKARTIYEEIARLVEALVKKKLAGYFGSYSTDDVSGIVNDTLIIVCTNLKKGKILDFSNPPPSLQSYFWRIADNLCKKYRRDNLKDKKILSLSEEDDDGNERVLPSNTADAEKEMLREEHEKIYRLCLIQALDELKSKKPDKYKLLISYSNNIGKTQQEMKDHREKMAEELGITQNALTIRINRIRENLNERRRKCLTAKGL